MVISQKLLYSIVHPPVQKLRWAGIFLMLLFIPQLSCSSPTDPNDNLQPGRRDYVWSVDTLFLPFNFFTDISGTSPADVWVCGPGGDLDKTFYYYNGHNWISDLVSRPFSPVSISSKGADNVWCGGQNGMIWNFNGLEWSPNYQHNINDNNSITFQNIKVISTNKILSAGFYFISPNYWGIILIYNGTKWEQIEIPLIRTTFAEVKESDNGKTYLWGVTNESGRYQFFELDGDNLKEIFNGSIYSVTDYGSLLQLGTKTFFIIGYDFFSYNGYSFNKIGRLSNDPKFLNVGWGRNEKDIFLGMRDGIAHYNSENTAYLWQSTENIFIRKGIIFDTEVFFIGRDPYGNNLMIHGKLNEQ